MGDVLAEGWLLKKPVNPWFGGLGSKARQRWFVVRTTPLKTVKIEYYSDDSQEKLKGTLNVTGESVLTKVDGSGFTLTTKSGTLAASAEGDEERDEWCNRLQEAIQLATRARSASVRLAAERAASRRAREAAAADEEEEVRAHAIVPVMFLLFYQVFCSILRSKWFLCVCVCVCVCVCGFFWQEEPENNAGCYLVWSEASDGSLIERWSKDLVEGALARFLPQKPVPGYKYKRHGGNSELLRDIRVPTRLFKGIATFCKTARESDGLLQISPDKVGACPLRLCQRVYARPPSGHA